MPNPFGEESLKTRLADEYKEFDQWLSQPITVAFMRYMWGLHTQRIDSFKNIDLSQIIPAAQKQGTLVEMKRIADGTRFHDFLQSRLTQITDDFEHECAQLGLAPKAHARFGDGGSHAAIRTGPEL